ncbi:MAG TPA: hypothetical protein VFA18_05080 [Gemmataceae bacterium]|nr:hypothetical protein [Gemmataceae bacterium]
MSTARLRFIEITVRLEPNTSSFSILGSEDPHATHKAEYSASNVDGVPDKVLTDVLQGLAACYGDPQGSGLLVQVRGDTITGTGSDQARASARATSKRGGRKGERSPRDGAS